MALEFREPASSPRALVALGIGACVLQVALAPQFSLLGGRFNFMIVFAGVVALRGNARQAVYAGFFSGLFYDLTAAVPVGLMTLLTTVASFALATVGGSGANGFSSASVRLMAAFTAAICLVNAIGLVLLGTEGSILASIGHAVSTTALTVLASVPALMLAGGPSSSAGFTVRGGRGGSRYSAAPRGRHAKKRARGLR